MKRWHREHIPPCRWGSRRGGAECRRSPQSQSTQPHVRPRRCRCCSPLPRPHERVRTRTPVLSSSLTKTHTWLGGTASGGQVGRVECKETGHVRPCRVPTHPQLYGCVARCVCLFVFPQPGIHNPHTTHHVCERRLAIRIRPAPATARRRGARETEGEGGVTTAGPGRRRACGQGRRGREDVCGGSGGS
jgi:hypothetical protein